MVNTTQTLENLHKPAAIEQIPRMRYFSWGLPLFAIVWAIAYFSLSKDAAGGFHDCWPLIGVGFLTGILANISAVGGGLVFIPVMLFFFHFPAVLALKATLASQSIALSSGSIAWYQTGKVNTKLLRYTVPGLLVGSTISSLMIHPSAFLIKTIFGPVSILIGIATLLMLNRSSQKEISTLPKSLPLFLISIIGGMITGWISIGEGEVIAAYLMLACGASSASSIGLGVILLAINSIYLTIVHSLFLGGVPWHIAAFTMLGAVYGARLAPFLSQWISARTLKIIFSIIAIADGILFLVQVFVSHGIK